MHILYAVSYIADRCVVLVVLRFVKCLELSKTQKQSASVTPFTGASSGIHISTLVQRPYITRKHEARHENDSRSSLLGINFFLAVLVRSFECQWLP